MRWRRVENLVFPPRRPRERLPRAMPVLGGVMVVVAVAIGVGLPGGRPPPSDGGTPVRPVATSAGRRMPATTTTALQERWPPLVATVSAPLRVLEIGDSLGIDLGEQLQPQLDATGRVTTTVASVGDTGLANTSFYDWPAHLAALLTSDRPQVVVVFLGANDDQGLDIDGTAAEPGSSPWAAGYAQRVDEVLAEATGAGARVVWVGMPPMQDPDLNAAMALEDGIYQRQTENFPGTLYVSSAPVLGTASGLYRTTGVDAAGSAVALRTPDGVHLTPDGASVLAGVVIAAIDGRWHLFLDEPPAPGPRWPGPGPG